MNDRTAAYAASDARRYARGDALMLLALGVSMLATWAIGGLLARPGLSLGSAMVWSLCVAAPAALGFAAARATLWSRVLMAASLSGMVILHIQLAAGQTEFHFGVFVTLALLMVYLDWRPIILSAALFAVQHVLFDRLQAAGWGVYCLTQPDFYTVVVHALYVVVQTGFEVYLVWQLATSVRNNAEVAQLARQLQSDTKIVLDLSSVKVQAPVALELKEALGRMAQAIGTVREATQGIQGASAEIASGTQDLSARTEQASRSLEQTSASISSVTQTVQHSAQSAKEASHLASQAADVAARGGSVVKEVVHTMDQINQSSRKIADIIGVIDSIAFQTNILALNAAVEAARAGEQGRGFAVVAGEVRLLAQRSAQAAREIKDLIQDSVGKVQAGAELVEHAGNTMDEIVQSVKHVNDMISDISAAALSQSEGISMVNQAIGQLEQLTQQNASLVEESSAAAASLQEQADRMTQVIELFR